MHIWVSSEWKKENEEWKQKELPECIANAFQVIIIPATAQLHIHTLYGTAKKKRPGYLVGNLVATNWPIEKALHAIGYNQIPTK